MKSFYTLIFFISLFSCKHKDQGIKPLEQQSAKTPVIKTVNNKKEAEPPISLPKFDTNKIKLRYLNNAWKDIIDIYETGNAYWAFENDSVFYVEHLYNRPYAIDSNKVSIQFEQYTYNFWISKLIKDTLIITDSASTDTFIRMPE